MNITLIGYIFCIAVFLLFSNINYMIMLVIISTLFHSTSFMWIGDSRISLFELCSFFLIIRFMIYTKGKLFYGKAEKFFLLFLVCVWITTIVSTFLFLGMPIDNFHAFHGVIYHDAPTSICLSFSEIILLIRLTLRIGVFLIIWNVSKTEINNKQIDKLVFFSVSIVLIIGLLQYLHTIGVIDFDFVLRIIHDEKLSEGDAYYSSYNKLYSVFREPSYCGPWLVSMFWAFIISKVKIKNKCLILSLILLEALLSFSASAVLTFAIMMLVYIKERKTNSKMIIQIALIIVSVVVGSLFSSVVRRIIFETITKLSSSSGIERLAKIQYAYKLFVETKFIGVGFQRAQCMTLISGLLSQVGLISTLVFVCCIVALLKYQAYSNEAKFVKYFFLGVLISTEISCAGLLYVDTFWFALYLFGVGIAGVKNVSKLLHEEEKNESNIIIGRI